MITKTGWFIIATVFLWIACDIYLFANELETISDVIFGYSQNIKGIIFFVGFVCGHWFVGYPVTKEGKLALIREEKDSDRKD